VGSNASADLAWLTESRNVAVLHWPREAEEAERLERQGIPHLLLVEEGASPPLSSSCVEDWVALPATDREIQIRLVNLARRSANHSPPITVDELGQLSYGGTSLFLSPIDQRLAQALVENFGTVVTERELIERVWPDGATNQALRVHVSRLRQRLLPLRLTITCVRSTGYVMAERDPLDPLA